ncbi:MAG: AAA family ATPase [Campylobacterales bacterium]
MPKLSSLTVSLLAGALVLVMIAFAIATPWWAVLMAMTGMGLFLWPLRKSAAAAAPRQGAVATAAQEDAPVQPVRSNVTFKQVAGLGGVREELEELVDYFKNPEKYRRFGVSLPKGVLLAGPPGVGKTLMAKAVAGEAGVPFFYASGPSFVQMYVGIGPKKVRELFAAARKSAPAIVFIDEIDAVGKARGGHRGDERENTLNQLLTEMDGFESGAQVVVIAATNRIEMLDDALLRPGRFDRRVEVGLPGAADRRAILEIYLAGKPHGLDVQALSERTVGFSGAALAALANEAAIHALRRGAAKIESVDVDAVKEKVISLKKSGDLLDDALREKLSRYQAAKALAAKKLGVAFEAARLQGDFLRLPSGIVAQEALFGLIAAHLAGLAYFDNKGEGVASFSEADISSARTLAERYLGSFDPLGREDAQALLTRAYEAAAGALSTRSVGALAKKLLESESVAFDLF